MVDPQQVTKGNVPAVVFYDPTTVEPIVTVHLPDDDHPPAEWFQLVLRQALEEGSDNAPDNS